MEENYIRYGIEAGKEIDIRDHYPNYEVRSVKDILKELNN